jgi:hypothetical protein
MYGHKKACFAKEQNFYTTNFTFLSFAMNEVNWAGLCLWHKGLA